jgi:hypothetical protein
LQQSAIGSSGESLRWVAKLNLMYFIMYVFCFAVFVSSAIHELTSRCSSESAGARAARARAAAGAH